MIDCIFTIDYEIYGNGEGSLQRLVFDPSEKLRTLFRKWNSRLVVFVEVAEMEMIGAERTDPAIDIVEQQIRDFYETGSEIGLHIHPQWYNARYEASRWILDPREYNICRLSSSRINRILERSIEYLRKCLGDPSYTPLSFRSGNWIMQPTLSMAKSLSSQGIKIDSSVFKGGLLREYKVDYRRSRKNGYYWFFSEDVNVPDPDGMLLEMPTYTKSMPTWRMKSVRQRDLRQMLQAKLKSPSGRYARISNYLRVRQAVKLDFSTLSAKETIRIIDREIEKDRKDPGSYRPIVAIAHTKTLFNFETIELLLSHLNNKGISIVTLRGAREEIMKRNRLMGA
jgi:hypothetical protein